MENLIVYGIPNCDTTRKLLLWLKEKNIGFHFHDYKKSGISKTTLSVWCKQVGWEKLLNKRGTTWKGLPPEIQEKITSQSAAVNLMAENTSLIKRPVVETGGKLLVGFDEKDYLTHIKI